MQYFFIYNDPYEREKMKRTILGMGFREESREILGAKSFRYVKGETFVNFTSPSEGRMQIQTYSENPTKDVLELKVKLHPDKVVNSNCDEINLN